MTAHLAVVLVEPSGPLNVGSVARLCANFGVTPAAGGTALRSQIPRPSRWPCVALNNSWLASSTQTWKPLWPTAGVWWPALDVWKPKSASTCHRKRRCNG